MLYAVGKSQSSNRIRELYIKAYEGVRKYFYLEGIFYSFEAKEYQESAGRENF